MVFSSGFFQQKNTKRTPWFCPFQLISQAWGSWSARRHQRSWRWHPGVDFEVRGKTLVGRMGCGVCSSWALFCFFFCCYIVVTLLLLLLLLFLLLVVVVVVTLWWWRGVCGVRVVLFVKVLLELFRFHWCHCERWPILASHVVQMGGSTLYWLYCRVNLMHHTWKTYFLAVVFSQKQWLKDELLALEREVKHPRWKSPWCSSKETQEVIMKKINFDDSKTSWAPFTRPLISVFLFANLVGSWPQDMMWDFMVYTNSATTSAKDVK